MKKNTNLLDEKIKRIKKSKNIDSLLASDLPPIQYTKYFFVSYSHRDYKKVYPDILKLQQHGIPIWYDQGLSSGDNWIKVVEQAVCRYACIGAIFYVSENSVDSTSIDEEIDVVLRTGKPFLSINLPIENIKGHIGETVSFEEMVALKNNTSQPKRFAEVFNNKTLYLKYDDSVYDKADSIRKIEKRASLLEYELGQSDTKKIASIKAVSDPYVVDVSIPDIVTNGVNNHEVVNIANGAFANCCYLKSVNLTMPRQIRIGDYAFFNCSKLTDIKLSSTISDQIQYIGEYAFAQTAIETFVVPVGTTVSKNAFAKSRLKTLIISGQADLKDYAFNDCLLLERVIIREGITEIKQNLFNGCRNIKSMRLPATLIKIEPGIFEGNIIEHLVVDENNPVYKSKDNCLILKESDTLIYTAKKIPASIKKIATSALQILAEEIVIPEGVEEIEAYAFPLNKSIGCIHIPHSVKKLGKDFFNMRYALPDSDFMTALPSLWDMKSYMNNWGRHIANEMMSWKLTFKYNGTVDEWESLVETSEIVDCYQTGTVICTDGEISLLAIMRKKLSC